MALSRNKIYFLGTMAVIICAACVTVPLVLNQKSHSSNPNNSTKAMATTIAEALATAGVPTSSQIANGATRQPPEPEPTHPIPEEGKVEPAGEPTDAPRPMNAEVPKHSEHPGTHATPEAHEATQPTHEVPGHENPPPTQEMPATTHEEPQHSPADSSPPQHPAAESSPPQHPPAESSPSHHHRGSTQPEQPHETQPAAMEQPHPDQRQPEHDNANNPASPEVPPAAESPAPPPTNGFPNGDHPMTTGEA